MKFTKMHGIGNDYVYVNGFEQSLDGVDLPELARRVSNRNFGIGSDGLILILPSERADFSMRVFNNDGSEAMNCGNGLRCVSKYVVDHGLTSVLTFTVETKGGIVTPTVHLGTDGKVHSVTIDMGEPIFVPSQIPMAGVMGDSFIEKPITINDRSFEITAVSMGNPHAVIFVEELIEEDVTNYGPIMEQHTLFPERANIEFIKVLSPDELLFRVWERGSGVTLACGTGACAAAVAAIVTGRTNRKVNVHLLGGDLEIEWREADNRVYMTGPATEVFTGYYHEPLPMLTSAREGA